MIGKKSHKGRFTLFPFQDSCNDEDYPDYKDKGYYHLEVRPYHLSCLILSEGLMMSVNLTPSFSFTTTTSPLATNLLFTSISIGSPASLSSSTTEPWPSCNRSLMSIFVFPS